MSVFIANHWIVIAVRSSQASFISLKVFIFFGGGYSYPLPIEIVHETFPPLSWGACSEVVAIVINPIFVKNTVTTIIFSSEATL